LKEPVNGAFGWALGVRLPAAFEVRTNDTAIQYVDPRGKVPPFEQVVLDLTGDRTICAITGVFNQADPQGVAALNTSLEQALRQKYIFKKKTAEGGVNTIQFGEGAREVILATTVQPPTLALCYRDTESVRKAQEEMTRLKAAARN
jgi:hypothetical protein